MGVYLRLGLLGEMPETTKTTVNQGDNGQYKTTIPKALGDAFDLDGKRLEWRVSGSGKLEAKINDD